jgi:hypothetical protein
MRKLAFVMAASMTLAGCVSPYFLAKLGRISGPVVIMWVGENKFVYVPGRKDQSFAFETATTGRVIEPGLMYTDGGSIPRFTQAFQGFSPWGYGPAYVIHDWIFYGRHCYVDRNLPGQEFYEDATRFADVNGDSLKARDHPRYKPISFDESALVLAEVIKTLVDYGQVPPRNVPAELISMAVDSPFALALWNQEGACDGQRVDPRHIAIAWLRTVGKNRLPPPTWRLSAGEVIEAQKYFGYAEQFIRSVSPDGLPPKQGTKPPIVDQTVVSQSN